MQILAGGGGWSLVDGQGTMAQFKSPTGITSDSLGTLYVVDSLNNAVRTVTSGGRSCDVYKVVCGLHVLYVVGE